MKKNDTEKELVRQFSDFIECDTMAPSSNIDQAVLRRVAKDLKPAAWKVFAKLTLVEAAAGLVTLTICPQFGLGFGRDNGYLHQLHASTFPALFYLLCGMLFVTLGAALGGLVLNRHEIRAVSQTSNLYFAGYSLAAYIILVTLGPQLFVPATLTWVLGAMLGNLLGYEAVIRVRHAVLRR
jgi:hypothetical protein